jgi:CheY-like chemotaxis protein
VSARRDIVEAMAATLWADVARSRRTPAAAVQAAEDLIALYEADNGRGIVELAHQAVYAGNGEPPGAVLALLALGHMQYPPDGLDVPSFEVTYDNGELSWDGVAVEPRRNPSSAVADVRILLLEDEPALQAGTSRWISKIFPGTPIVVVDNVDAAIAAVELHNIIAIVSDVDVLGDKSGIDFFHWVKAHHPDLVDRFVFFTGNSAAERAHYRYVPKGSARMADLKAAIIARHGHSTEPPRPRAATKPPTLNLDQFAEAVAEAAPRITNEGGSRGARGRFGDRKLFVSALWRQLQHDPRFAGLSYDRFKEMLVAAHRQRLLSLARADLVSAMDSTEVADSLIALDGASFHFVVDPNIEQGLRRNPSRKPRKRPDRATVSDAELKALMASVTYSIGPADEHGYAPVTVTKDGRSVVRWGDFDGTPKRNAKELESCLRSGLGGVLAELGQAQLAQAVINSWGDLANEMAIDDGDEESTRTSDDIEDDDDDED